MGAWQWRWRGVEGFEIFLETAFSGLRSHVEGVTRREWPRGKARFGAGASVGGWEWETGAGGSRDSVSSCVNWGDEGACAPGCVSAPYPKPEPPLQPSSLCFTGGACHSWGWNEHGMCGDGSGADVWAPKPVQALRSSAGLLVGCGAGHSLALCQLPALPSPDASEDAKSQEATDREQLERKITGTAYPTPT